jgi:hypothetical protein
MNRCYSRVIACFLILLIQLPLAAQADHVRIRTFTGMEPYGRISSRHWGSDNATKVWNASYGLLPGIEAYWMMNDRVEIGAGFQWMFNRRVFRDEDVEGERSRSFHFMRQRGINLMEVRVSIHMPPFDSAIPSSGKALSFATYGRQSRVVPSLRQPAACTVRRRSV